MRNTIFYRSIACILMTVCLSGCVGYVAGDLRNIKTDYRMTARTNVHTDYQVIYKSDAKNDYGDKNVAGIISSFTLGIVPTYWTTTVHSEATILHNNTPVFNRKYKSRIHVFYGILWGIIFPTNSKNTIQADEGNGLEIEWEVQNRTLNKIVSEHGGKENQYCLMNKDDSYVEKSNAVSSQEQSSQ